MVDSTVKAATGLIKASEEGAGMPISLSKGQVAASKVTISNGISKRLQKYGVKGKKTLTVLGTSTAASAWWPEG